VAVLTRRTMIRSAAALAAGSGLLAPPPARAQITPGGGPLPQVKALVFDTFGTVIDWRNGVAREAETILNPSVTRSTGWLSPMLGARNMARAWRKSAVAAGRSSNSIFCTGKISIAFSRASAWKRLPFRCAMN